MSVFIVQVLWRDTWEEFTVESYSAAGALLEATKLVREKNEVSQVWGDVDEVHVARVRTDNEDQSQPISCDDPGTQGS